MAASVTYFSYKRLATPRAVYKANPRAVLNHLDHTEYFGLFEGHNRVMRTLEPGTKPWHYEDDGCGIYPSATLCYGIKVARKTFNDSLFVGRRWYAEEQVPSQSLTEPPYDLSLIHI